MMIKIIVIAALTSMFVGIYFLIRGDIFLNNSQHWLTYKRPAKWKWYYSLFIFGEDKNLFKPLK